MADVKITVRPNGPYRVTGNVDLVDVAGNPFPKNELGFSLCRCGHSARSRFAMGATRGLGSMRTLRRRWRSRYRVLRRRQRAEA